jgi:plasmid stabilization system protein ParE
MRNVEWSDRAVDNFAEQVEFITQRSPSGAARVRDRVQDAIAKLAFAHTGRVGRKPGTFEKFVSKTSLIIVYSLPDKATLTVVRIIHTSRDFSERNWPA